MRNTHSKLPRSQPRGADNPEPLPTGEKPEAHSHTHSLSLSLDKLFVVTSISARQL